MNRTDGATLEPGLQVTLHSFSQSSGVFLSQDAATDDSGSFLFPNVELLEEGGYAVVTDYADTRYSALFRPEDLDKPVELVVYETTQDISVIRVVHQALILTKVDPRDQMITAAIFVNLSNESDRTLLPDLTNVGPRPFQLPAVFSASLGGGVGRAIRPARWANHTHGLGICHDRPGYPGRAQH